MCARYSFIRSSSIQALVGTQTRTPSGAVSFRRRFPLKMTMGRIEPSAVTVSTTVICRFSAPVLRITQDFTQTQLMVFPGTRSKYTGVSSMFPIKARGNLPFFLSFCNFCRYNFILLSSPVGSLCESDVFVFSVKRNCTFHFLQHRASAASNLHLVVASFLAYLVDTFPLLITSLHKWMMGHLHCEGQYRVLSHLLCLHIPIRSNCTRTRHV